MARKLFLHIGWPKAGSTTLQEDVFPAVPGMRFLGKVPFRADQNLYLRQLVHLLCFATESRFRARCARAAEDLAQAERERFGAVDPSQPLILSDEAFTSMLLFPADVGIYGVAVACPERLADRLVRWAEAAGVELEVLLVDRAPADLVHSYYAQLFHLIRGIKGLSSFERYLDLGTGDSARHELGFETLKPGSLVQTLADAGCAVKSIELSALFADGHANLPTWSEGFSTRIAVQGSRNTRSRGRGVKITHLRPIWVPAHRPSVRQLARRVVADLKRESFPHAWIEVPIELTAQRRAALEAWFGKNDAS